MNKAEPDKLLILWTTSERDVVLKMMTMYASNSRKNEWWKHVSLLLWGPSQKLFLDDEEVQSQVLGLQAAGVRLMACVSCADQYGITSALREKGLEVFGMGPVLTNWLKSDSRVVTL
jgi:hypothetical protein